MAVRPLVNLERLTTAHVNSVDGSMTYESGVEYKANPTVSYNGSLYTANVDIENTDTDTPDAAPEKWSMTINASETGTSGDISALAARVTALEGEVEDLNDNMDVVKNITDRATNTYALMGQNYLEVVQEAGDTYGSVFVKLIAALNNAITALGDNERVEVIGLQGPFNALPMVTYMYNNTNTVHSLSFFGTAFTNSWTSSQFYNMYLSDVLADNRFLMSTLGSGSQSFSSDMINTTVPDGYKFGIRLHKYKILKAAV